MWGDGVVGFGDYHYRYASGREGDWFLAGFSPRKQNLTVYIMSGFAAYDELLGRLGDRVLALFGSVEVDDVVGDLPARDLPVRRLDEAEFRDGRAAHRE